MAGRERGTRDAMAASWFGYDGVEEWELQWDLSIRRLGHSQYGVTGFARVISRSSGGPVPVELIRAHLCRHNPCQGRWEHESKYGELGFPMHVQLAETIPAPVPPPAAVHLHPVEAQLGPGDGGEHLRPVEADGAFYF